MSKLIALLGGYDESAMFRHIIPMLESSKAGFIAFDGVGAIKRRGASFDVAVVDCVNDVKELCDYCDIIIFKKDRLGEIVSIPPFCRFGAAILPDDIQISPSSAMPGQGGRIITCGTNPKSTVTVSSNIEGRLCMFIQRSLTSLLETHIEQQELTLTLLDENMEYEAMASSLCSLLLDF